jgi:hypothetical protein
MTNTGFGGAEDQWPLWCMRSAKDRVDPFDLDEVAERGP